MLCLNQGSTFRVVFQRSIDAKVHLVHCMGRHMLSLLPEQYLFCLLGRIPQQSPVNSSNFCVGWLQITDHPCLKQKRALAQAITCDSSPGQSCTPALQHAAIWGCSILDLVPLTQLRSSNDEQVQYEAQEKTFAWQSGKLYGMTISQCPSKQKAQGHCIGASCWL